MNDDVCYMYTEKRNSRGDREINRCTLCDKINPERVKIWKEHSQCMSGLPVCHWCASKIADYVIDLRRDF